MTFGPSHYVPVLKVKRGEKGALQRISPVLRPLTTPLLEVVEWRTREKPSLSGHLDTAFKDLAKSLHGYPPCFLDARELAPHGQVAALEVFSRAVGAGIPFIPVTGISDRADVSAALEQEGAWTGHPADSFRVRGLENYRPVFMASWLITTSGFEATDLILDLGPVEDMVAEGVTRLATQFLGDVPRPESWRNLIVSASAFPKSMEVVERHSNTVVERSEWLAWKCLRDGGRLVRVPTYSDCAIQHPAGVEGFDPVRMQVSAHRGGMHYPTVGS